MSSLVIYLHGFNSASTSPKALSARSFFEDRSYLFWAPNLGVDIKSNIKTIKNKILEHQPRDKIYFIASSLGAYQLTSILNGMGKFEFKAVLINPAVQPYDLFESYLGPGVNPYTQEKYIIEREHLVDLRSISQTTVRYAENYFILLAEGDKVLDYKLAVDFYVGAKQVIVPGSSHALDEFESFLPDIDLFFCN